MMKERQLRENAIQINNPRTVIALFILDVIVLVVDLFVITDPLKSLTVDRRQGQNSQEIQGVQSKKDNY